MLPISSCLDIDHVISFKDNAIIKHMITGMVKKLSNNLIVVVNFINFLLEPSTISQGKMATTPPATPILPPVIPAPPNVPITQLISILINVVNVGGALVDLIQQSNNCRIIAQQDFPDAIRDFLDLEERGITDLVTAYESKRDPTE